MPKLPSKTSAQLPPTKHRRNPVALAVYDYVFRSGLNKVDLAKNLFKELDKLMNRMLRRGIAAGILREQKRMLDALANDTTDFKENKNKKGEVVSVTLTYNITAWNAIGSMLDKFAEQEELAAVEKGMQDIDKEKPVDGTTPTNK